MAMARLLTGLITASPVNQDGREQVEGIIRIGDYNTDGSSRHLQNTSVTTPTFSTRTTAKEFFRTRHLRGLRRSSLNRGLAFGDFDNDGDLDILIVNINEPPSLLRNDITGNDHWLKVQLQGTVSNRSAIGATVVATYGGRRQAKPVLAQSSYLSVNDPRLHFSLRQETKADLEITWPNGAKQSIKAVDANRLVVVREPDKSGEGGGIVRTDTFSRK